MRRLAVAVVALAACWLAQFPVGCPSNPSGPINNTNHAGACYDTTFMLKTTDGGATWTRMTIKGANWMLKRTADLGIGLSDSGSALVRFLAGDSTACAFLPSLVSISDVEWEAGETWVASDGLYRTSDYGSHWTHVATPTSMWRIEDFEFGGGGVCLIAMSNSVYRSTDFGQTWDPNPLHANAGATDLVMDIQFINNFGDMYVITMNGWVYRSTSSGATWELPTNTGYGNFNATYSDDVGAGTCQVIVGDLGLILRSTTGAGRWELVNHPTGAANLTDVTTNGARWWAVGGHEIWHGDPDATNWTVYTYPDPAVTFNDITFFDQNTGYIVGGY